MKSLILIAASATLLTACVPMVETRVNTSGGGAGMPPSEYILAPAEKTPSPELAQAEQRVAEQLMQKRFAPSPTGDLYLQVTASSRPADLKLVGAQDSKSATASAAPKKRLFSNCMNSEYRVSVTLTRISDGDVAYHGTAAETHCGTSFAQALPALVDAALGDLHLPVGIAGREGTYVLKRRLKAPKN
jgi:hypothetical protein